MRRSFTWLAPVAVGALVFALAAAYPASTVRGSGLTGPKPPRSASPVPAGRDYRARWADHDRAIVLRVRDGAACRPRLEHETSTGPGRIELALSRPTGADCLRSPRWWDLRLQPPTIRARPQPVGVYIDGRFTSLGPPPPSVRA